MVLVSELINWETPKMVLCKWLIEFNLISIQAISTIGYTRAQDGTESSTTTQLPARWEAAIRNMIATVMEKPTEEMSQLVIDQVVSMRPQVDLFFKDLSEDKQAAFVEDLMTGLAKAILKRSRVPIQHRMSNAAIKVIINYMGKLPSKKTLTQEIIDEMKAFSKKLLAFCQADRKCRRFM